MTNSRLPRRALCAAPLAATLAALSPSGVARAQGGGGASFDAFLDGVRAEARRAGVSPATLGRALAGLRPSERVLELDRRQAEFTQTWEGYRDGRLSQSRIERGRQLRAESRALLASVAERFRVPPGPVLAIWGLETNYGAFTGNFNAVEALATLAWDGRRSAYFRSELMAALRILDEGHVAPDRMKGSHAGALGQPQFMPTNFFRLAVDHDGDGRRDIWDSRADALASIANYLARNGWRHDERWGREVVLPASLAGAPLGREDRRPVRDWARLGVRAADGTDLSGFSQEGAVVRPRGDTGQAFLVYHNFGVIRRYNPSDFYALAVGMLSDLVG